MAACAGGRCRPGAGRLAHRRLVGLAAVAAALWLALAPAWRSWPAGAFAVGKRVLVTGAGGRTGRLVVERLLATGRYDVRALVRSEKSKQALLKANMMLQEKNVFVGDIQDPETLTQAFAGIFALICATSAVPKLKFASLIPFLFKKLIGKKGKLRFGWKGGKPEQVDWEGQRNQFDMAKKVGAKKVVLVGTMTGTQKDSFLNSIGDGEGDNIVMWKRKAEVHLIDVCKSSDIEYTIIHAGGLSDEPAGQSPVAVGVDDKLREVKPNKRVARADIAQVCVQALQSKSAANRSFDITGLESGIRLVEGGLDGLLETLGGANCDYSINPPP